MDSATAVLLDGTRLLGWIHAALWLSMRLGAAFLAAPLFGSRAVPPRVRMALMFALSAMLAPMLPKPPPAAFDALTVLNVMRELAIGVAIGFLLRLAFEAGAFAGELISQGMALSFAQMADPANGAPTVVGQWFYVALALLFLSFDGHLALIQLLADSYRLQPPGQPLPDWTALAQAVPAFLTSALAAGVAIALPIVLSMLVVNLCFGVLGRASPALQPIAIGIPAALLLGIALLVMLITRLVEPARSLFDAAFAAARGLLG